MYGGHRENIHFQACTEIRIFSAVENVMGFKLVAVMCSSINVQTLRMHNGEPQHSVWINLEEHGKD